ncbi:imelysin family protein [Paracoccus onubensis]|uniref:Signal peptidase n=1 Tax=Paracoccus onubensis TaxID=1675788 RepID=A0A418SVI9_9RHOB|nr:imelysin family protein [Paracoccus onubensis]RJE84898.1 signal peptidase [Paracoccus onubensis]
MRKLALLLALLPLPAAAGIQETIDTHIMPAAETFSAATKALADAAAKDCTSKALHQPYQHAFDAWMGLSHLSFGPLETDGRALAIEFWPDPRGMVARTVGGMIADADPAVDDPAQFAAVSVAGRGFMALEQLLYDDDLSSYGPDDYACRYVQAIGGDLNRMAGDILADWSDHTRLMTDAGADGNTHYLSESEVTQTFYTALLTTLEFNTDQRLGRPLGTFERPRPTRAEAYRSGRSLRNLTLSLSALHDLAGTMFGADMPVTGRSFETALETAGSLDDPIFAGVKEPQSRLRIEILQQQVHAIRDAVSAEIGGELGLSAGFNSRDGD